MRNVEKFIEHGRKLVHKRPRMQLLSSEIIDIYDRRNGDVFYLIGDAFYLGVTVGYRIAKKEKQRKRD